MADSNKELRAFEAILASQLLRDRDPLDLDDLPPVGESRLPKDLVARLWAKVSAETANQAEHATDVAEEDTAAVPEEEMVGAGMNRAEEMDDETRATLEQLRQEVLEAMRRVPDELDNANE